MKMDLESWIRQPTTIHAIGMAAATLGGVLAQLTTGNAVVDAFVSILAYVLVHAGIDDNTAPPK